MNLLNHKKIFFISLMILLLAVPVMGQEINKPYETKAPKIEVLTTTASHSMARY